MRMNKVGRNDGGHGVWKNSRNRMIGYSVTAARVPAARQAQDSS
jgi:hypothetical protein